MKILVISPCFDEFPADEGKYSPPVNELMQSFPGCIPELSASLLDLSEYSLAEMTLDVMYSVLKRVDPLEQFDIIHTFSAAPFVFRALFPQLMISSFNIEKMDKKFRPFMPGNDDPGYARQDIHSLDSTAVCELYPEAYNNRRSFDERPWGWWKSLVLSKNYKVKQIYVAPEAKLSLQTHKFRSEIWIIAQGNGWVTAGDKKMTAEKGSVFNIGRGEVHRAEGGEGGLYIIELQIGDYLGEDDIIRLEDIYGRK